MSKAHDLELAWTAALDRVLELSMLLGRDMTQHLAESGLTDSRAHVLWELRRRGPSTQRTLATALDVAPRTVTGLVDGLVATGFVTREVHPGDRRAVLVTLTARGSATAETLATGHRQLARELFAALPAEVFAGLDAGLAEVLDRLRAALAQEGEAAPRPPGDDPDAPARAGA